MGDVISSFLFQPPSEPTPLDESKYFFIETAQKHNIPAFYIKHHRSDVYTILYSHGNAEDLGMIYEYLSDLSKLLRVNIMAYDYTGYGLRDNVENPSEEACYFDIEAAYHYLTETESVPMEKIILYGRSVGSGPSCYLAQKLNREVSGTEHGLGGLVLHSPFLSVIRVAVDLGFTVSGDQFPNIDRIKDISCPVFIIHGTHDEIVPFYHGHQLFSSIEDTTKNMSFWAKNLGHNNIEMEVSVLFVRNLQAFLKKVARHSRRAQVKRMKTLLRISVTEQCKPTSQHQDAECIDARSSKQMYRYEGGLDDAEVSNIKQLSCFNGHRTNLFKVDKFTTYKYVESRDCTDRSEMVYGQSIPMPERIEAEEDVRARDAHVSVKKTSDQTITDATAVEKGDLTQQTHNKLVYNFLAGTTKKQYENQEGLAGQRTNGTLKEIKPFDKLSISLDVTVVGAEESYVETRIIDNTVNL